MAAYVVGEIEITDPAGYEEYRKQVLAVVTQYGGRFAARGGRTEVLEGGSTVQRMVIVEFPTFEQAQKWYRSKEYAPLITMRQRASKGRLVLIEGA